MNQGLKLARFAEKPISKTTTIRKQIRRNSAQPPALRNQVKSLEPGGFASLDNLRKIHVGGEVLVAGLGQEIRRHLMATVRPKRALSALRAEPWPIGIAIIQSHEPAAGQVLCGDTPPGHGFRAFLDDVAVGQHAFQGAPGFRPP